MADRNPERERTKVTSLDVAAKAGVSQSAVSRVFSGASASAATTAKVRAAADALGYRPNVLARSLITGQSRIIGLVVAYLDNQFYPDALERLSHALQVQGYHIMIFIAGGAQGAAEGTGDRVIDRMLDHQVDAIVAASVGLSDALVARCRRAGIPVVLFNRGQIDSCGTRAGLAQITSDNIGGARHIADYLLACGHASIGHVRGWQGSSTGRDRTMGFVDRLGAAGIVPRQEDGEYRRDHAEAAARKLMARGVDAIFVGNDHMAFAVLDVLRHEMGLDVPGDVAVVGYDDVPMAAWAGYDLTTLRQPVGRMIDATVEALLAVLGGGDQEFAAQEIGGPLVVRGSTRMPLRPVTGDIIRHNTKRNGHERL